VKIWDREILNLAKELKGHEDTVQSVSFSYDAKKIVSGSNDKTIIIWNADNGQ
jgi:WD40 repeat protein